MIRTLACAALLLAASTAVAEQLATVVEVTFDHFDLGEAERVSIDVGGYPEPQFILSPGIIGVPIVRDSDNWHGGGADSAVRLTVFASWFGDSTIEVPTLQGLGSYDYMSQAAPGVNVVVAHVSRLLPIFDDGGFGEVYSSATWTLDALAQGPEERHDFSGFALAFTITGRYYVAPEPSAFMMCLSGTHLLLVSYRRRSAGLAC